MKTKNKVINEYQTQKKEVTITIRITKEQKKFIEINETIKGKVY
jgi:uncharacterized protein (DUF1778 family)